MFAIFPRQLPLLCPLSDLAYIAASLLTTKPRDTAELWVHRLNICICMAHDRLSQIIKAMADVCRQCMARRLMAQPCCPVSMTQGVLKEECISNPLIVTRRDSLLLDSEVDDTLQDSQAAVRTPGSPRNPVPLTQTISDWDWKTLAERETRTWKKWVPAQARFIARR